MIAPGRVERFLQALPVEALWGVGPVTAGKLRRIGIERLVDVRTADDERLRGAVGNLAGWLRRLAQGDDPRPVTPDRPWKSISAEDTYARDLDEPGEMRAEIEHLARRVAASLEKKSLRARTVTIKVRYADFSTVTRSHTGSGATRDARQFTLRALALLERTDAGRQPVRLLGVGAHGLAEDEGFASGPESLPFDEER